jgi:hypothetical protein
MDILQTYETTISSESGAYSLTVLTIPARSYGYLSPEEDSLREVAAYLLESPLKEFPSSQSHMALADCILKIVSSQGWQGDESNLFANYAIAARVIPFEQSPLGAESLSSIAVSSVKAGTIGLGATVGYISAGPTPFLLITVPLGIVLCGASVSFAKWLEENRAKIWGRLLARAAERPMQPHLRKSKITNPDK